VGRPGEGSFSHPRRGEGRNRAHSAGSDFHSAAGIRREWERWGEASQHHGE